MKRVNYIRYRYDVLFQYMLVYLDFYDNGAWIPEHYVVFKVLNVHRLGLDDLSHM